MLIPSGFGQLNYKFVIASYPFDCEVTLGIDLGGVSGPIEDVPEAAYDIYSEHILANATSNVTMTEVSLKVGPNSTGPTYVHAGSDTGGKGGESVEPAVSILVRKTTATGGRQGSGRWYLPGYAESDVNPNGTLASLFLTDFQTSLTSFGSDMATAGLIPVVLRAADSPITTPGEITGFVLQSRVATQRRRNRR